MIRKNAPLIAAIVMLAVLCMCPILASAGQSGFFNISPPSPITCTLGQPLNIELQGDDGGVDPWSGYSVKSGSLPPGVSISDSNVPIGNAKKYITGTPTQAGVFTCVIVITFADDMTDDPYDYTQPLTITVLPKAPAGSGTHATQEAPEAPADPGQKAKIVGTGTPVPVYDGPTERAKVIGKVAPGDIVYLLRWNGNWCRLLYNDQKNAGWVLGAFIEVVP